MCNTYYVYSIIDPRTNLTIYIGKGQNYRYKVHEQIVRNQREPVNLKLHNKLAKIIAEGFNPVYNFLHTDLSEEEAYTHEQCIIDKIGLDNLCNLKRGGSCGATFTDEVKKKMSISALEKDYNKAYSSERNRKIAEAQRGRPRSEETKQKLREFWLNNPREQYFGSEKCKEISEKISKSNKGKKKSEEFKKAQSERMKGDIHGFRGKHHTDDWKQKRSNQALEFYKNNPKPPLSDETKTKISNAKKGKVTARKKWQITDIDGNILIVNSLKDFCIEHNLNIFSMYSVSQGMQKNHKGFICTSLNYEKIENEK